MFYLKQVKQKPSLFCGAQTSWGGQPRQTTLLPFIKHSRPRHQLALGTSFSPSQLLQRERFLMSAAPAELFPRHGHTRAVPQGYQLHLTVPCKRLRTVI